MNDDQVIEQALSILKSRMSEEPVINSNRLAEDYAMLRLGQSQKEGVEVFAAMYLDTSRRIISFETLFRGTVDRCSIYPREVARKALLCNASAVILVHNHPSGNITPSEADQTITQHIAEGLRLFEIELLDHIIVGFGESFSLASEGRI